MSRKFASPHGDDHDFDLPPGWYRKTDNYGRSFYVDTQSRKSYWRKPVAVKGGLVIKTEEERREFFKGIYTELARRQKRERGDLQKVPSFLELYRIANMEHVNENSFGSFLRKYIAKHSRSQRPTSSRHQSFSPHKNNRMRNWERARSAELANKASKEAKEYALKKKRQKELAKQKRFGNSWGKSPKAQSAKKSYAYGSNVSSKAKSRDYMHTMDFSTQNSHTYQSELGNVRQHSQGREKNMSERKTKNTRYDKGTLSINDFTHQSPNHKLKDNESSSLFHVVLNRTDEEKRRTSALRNAFINKRESIPNYTNFTRTPSGQGFFASQNEDVHVHGHTTKEIVGKSNISSAENIQPEPFGLSLHSATSTLKGSSLADISAASNSKEPHNDDEIKKQIQVAYDLLQQMDATNHAASSIDIPEASASRLKNAKRIIEAKVDEEISRLYKILAQSMSSRNPFLNHSGVQLDNDASNEGLKPNSISMANELERESLKRENAALKERLKNTIAIQENLRDSEASLKRQLLSLRADMARLEADAAGEVAAHASLAGQLRDLRSTSDSLIAARNVTIREMNEKIIFLQSSLQKLSEERGDIEKVNANAEMSLCESQTRIQKLETKERALLAKLQAREAEIDASHESRRKLKTAIDNEANARMKQKSLEAENKKLQSRLNGAYERISTLEKKQSSKIKENIMTSNVEYDEAMKQIKDLEYQLEFSMNTINDLKVAFAQANGDREMLAQKVLAIESENMELERECLATSERLKKIVGGTVEEVYREQMESETQRKINHIRKKIQEESDLAQRMSQERLTSKHQIEVERLHAESEMFLRESKSKMLAQLSQDKLDHEKIVEELKTQLKYTEEKCKLEIETCQVDCMSKIEDLQKEHEENLCQSLADKDDECEIRLSDLRKSHEEILDKVTQNLEKMFEERLEDLRINFHTSRMRARRGAAAKMLIMLFEQGDRYRRSLAMQTWRRHARVMALEDSERQSWKFCQTKVATERLKTFFHRRLRKRLTKAIFLWKRNIFTAAREKQQQHSITVGVSLQKLCGYWHRTNKLKLMLGFYRWKVHAIAVYSNLRLQVASERARDRQETQGLRFKQLYTDNNALRAQVKTLGRQVQDLVAKAELWRRRCISK